MQVEVSTGEALDKLTILEIKLKMIRDPAKLANVMKEYNSLKTTCNACAKVGNWGGSLYQSIAKLYETNFALWNVEDAIREKEKKQEFDEEFISLARRVYSLNDYRAAIKNSINLATNSQLVEEKEYNA